MTVMLIIITIRIMGLRRSPRQPLMDRSRQVRNTVEFAALPNETYKAIAIRLGGSGEEVWEAFGCTNASKVVVCGSTWPWSPP